METVKMIQIGMLNELLSQFWARRTRRTPISRLIAHREIKVEVPVLLALLAQTPISTGELEVSKHESH